MSVYVQPLPTSSIYTAEPNHYLFHSPPPPTPGSMASRSAHQHTRQRASKQRFFAELSQCLFDFVIQLLPTREELSIKEDVRRLLERLIRTIEPNSRLLSFGSTANGFALKNSDMDLCCLIDSEERLAAADLVTMLGNLLERETKFQVKPLPHARIPIVKLSLDPSPALPYGIACDIGFENRLALENTRLLMSYAMIDPARVRTMVLFLKIWSKRRKINSPYKGTLSSYGYVLLVLYFLVHVKNPPVLPNLQQIPPMRPISPEEMRLGEHNIWFFDDIELLRQRWQSANTETVAELLADFFKYYSRDFAYNTTVVSLRAGSMRKEVKGWQSPDRSGKYNDPRERNRFCIEDPFETDFNVARCVSKDGLYLIRGEFMRASRVFSSRPERALPALSELCEERVEQEDNIPMGGVTYITQKLTPIPPQTPYTVGSSSIRPQNAPPPGPDATLPASKTDEPSAPITENSTPAPTQAPATNPPSPPRHMIPQRSKWTSPPPPEASLADHTSFEDRFGQGIALATASTDAREPEHTYASSTSNSEVLTDDGRISDVADLDDVRSVQSFTEESVSHKQWSPQALHVRVPVMAYSYSQDGGYAGSPSGMGQPDTPGTRPRIIGGLRAAIHHRGRRTGKIAEERESLTPSPAQTMLPNLEALQHNAMRRATSGPPRTMAHRFSMPSLESMVPITPQPIVHSKKVYAHGHSPPSVFYETGAPSKERDMYTGSPVVDNDSREQGFPIPHLRSPQLSSPNPTFAYPPHHLMDPRHFSPSSSAASSPTVTATSGYPSPLGTRAQLGGVAVGATQRAGSTGPKTPTPGSTSSQGTAVPRRKVAHAHSHSAATIVAPLRDDTGSPALPSPATQSPAQPSSPLLLPSERSPSSSLSRASSRSRPLPGGGSYTSPLPTPPLPEGSAGGSKVGSGSVHSLQPPPNACPEVPSRLGRRGSPSSPGTDSPAPSSPNSSSYRSSPPSTSPPSPMHTPFRGETGLRKKESVVESTNEKSRTADGQSRSRGVTQLLEVTAELSLDDKAEGKSC